MKTQVRTALLSAFPVFFSGKSPSLSTLQGPVSTLQRRRTPLLNPAVRTASSTLPSFSASTATELNGSSRTPAVAASLGPITTTASRCTPETARGRHVFEIAGYSLLKGLGVGNCVKSATFSVGGYDWCIQYYPDGNSEDDDDYYRCDSDDEDEDDDVEDEGYVSVFVALMSKGGEVRALCHLRLVNPATGLSPWVRSSKKPKVFNGEGSSWGLGKFKQRSDLEDSGYLRNDCLQILCEIKVITGMPVTQSKTICDIQVPPSDLSADLQKFLGEEKRVDVTFKVKDEIFHAHKFVLSMRTPVFDTEFYGQRGVNKRQCITVEDMEPSVFKALLHFIYTDSLPSMDDLDRDEKEELVKSLLLAADRCGIERMKVMCESILCKGLTVENAATTLALAEQNHCSQLKDACIEFINSSDRMGNVVASQGYENLKIACPASVVDYGRR